MWRGTAVPGGATSDLGFRIRFVFGAKWRSESPGAREAGQAWKGRARRRKEEAVRPGRNAMLRCETGMSSDRRSALACRQVRIDRSPVRCKVEDHVATRKGSSWAPIGQAHPKN
ncbi:unnamed protein product [Chondrus crispus]|uniref:Uncharacterized protein n=1 Tax=Chondrus crispus TaxID=2769 RepID=R7QHH6_CHOCR|nr:unnamed protein product [Chondrus crispus]CDF37223.1 unnamed protein product [Chondrus crispus]|eukprot:XP_005717042.1 unnamed protein product [Chondrus crispus]